MSHEVYLVLLNIRSSHNVGSMFRTADACGVAKIFLVGYTPLPIDRWGKANKEIAKTALGAEKNIPWEHVATFGGLIKQLKKNGIEIVAVEQASDATDYKKYEIRKSCAFVFGREVEGIFAVDLKKCDKVLEIPMRGKKESLNVSVACGVILARATGL